MNVTRVLKQSQSSILVSDPKMIQYLIGSYFDVGERFLGLLLQDQHATLFLNQLFPYTNKELSLVRFSDDEDPISLVAQHIQSDVLHVDHVLPSGFLLRLMRMKPTCTYQLDSTLDQFRSIKNQEEINWMREASQLNDEVMAKVPTFLHVGVLESEVKVKIIALFNDLSEGCSFEPIIAFGDHAADPHAQAGDCALKAGEAIVIDMGCKVHGYCSDMTRTFFVGVNAMEKVYATVLKANLAAIAKVKPGVLLSDIDDAARSVITNAGYGSYFIHRTGHGIGTSVHEPYSVSSDSTVLCQEGMIFSIEPGIYLPGIGGVRIEDLVLVTADGVEVLNHYPKQAEIIVP